MHLLYTTSARMPMSSPNWFRWTLFAGASTTAVCDELIEAVAALRHNYRVGRLPVDERHLAAPANLIRVHGLLQFAADVNLGAGLGFLVQSRLCGRHLVTTRLVWRLVAGLAAISAIMYVLLYEVLTMH